MPIKIRKVFLSLVLVLFGLLSAEAILRLAGRYQKIDTVNLKYLWQLTNASADEIKEMQNRYIKYKLSQVPEDYTGREKYDFHPQPVYDFQYGLGLLPNCKCRDILVRNSEVIWDALSVTDSFSRRITPEAEKIRSDKFMVFYGGSRTFGYGVSDAETMPNQFQKLNSDYTVYNYGIISGAANIFLKMHEDRIFQQQIPQASGVFVYVYDTPHTDRILGTRYAPTYYNTPDYQIDLEQGVVSHGSFWHQRFWVSLAYHSLANSAIYQNIFLNVNHKSLAEDEAQNLELIVKIFLKMQSEAQKINQSQFVVVFFETAQDYEMKKIWQALRSAGIQTLVFSRAEKDFSLDESESFFAYDGHPKPSLYQKEAQLLRDRLKKQHIIF